MGQLAQKEVEPPFTPCDEQDYAVNFDPQFTREPAQLTPDEPYGFSNIYSKIFCLVPFNIFSRLFADMMECHGHDK